MKIFFYKGYLFLLFVACACIATAQTGSLKIDSLKKKLLSEKEDTNKINTLNTLSMVISKNGDYATAMNYADEALALAGKLKFKQGLIAAYNSKANVYGYINNDSAMLKNALAAYNMAKEEKAFYELAQAAYYAGTAYQNENNYPEALNFWLATLKIIEPSADKKAISKCYDALEHIYSLMNNDAEALKALYKVLKLREELRDTLEIARTLQYIGAAYLNNGNDSLALTYFNASLKNSKAIGNTLLANQTIISIGEIYRRRGELDKALENFKIGATDTVWKAWPISAIAGIYEEQGDNLYATNKAAAINKYNDALNEYFYSLKLVEADKHNEYNSINNINIGNTYFKLRQYAKAKAYLQKGLQNALLLRNKAAISTAYGSLSLVDSATGNFRQAYLDFFQFFTYRDSVTNEESAKKFTQTQMQYEFDAKQNVAKAEQDRKDTDAKRLKNQQYLVIIALGIIVLAVIIIALIQFRNNKQKQKANVLLQHQKKEIEQQKDKVESTLTELKSTQAQLIQSEKMASLGELTAGIAHEIQNPLNFVNNFSEVNIDLTNDMNDENDVDEIRAIANDIKQNSEKILFHGKRADAIVKGMLQHSRQTKGVKEPTDINALCDEYLRLSYHGLRAKDKSFNADFTTDFDESIGKINIVPQDIGRVLLNLFNNAFYTVSEKSRQSTLNNIQPLLNKYKPVVSVITKKLNNKIEIRVTDNGNGIPQNIIDKIFQPFFTTKPTGQGTGLGLSLAYDIITKEHNGTIKVESKEGDGSECIIQLPVTE